ncbi:MAG: hypothetical protein BGO98_27580 [Myxococcales bacterium 68-20]|nr:MAG: hypothetical protein BGO98_27580 [Myxococcales bacterium 68-20]
MKRPRGFFRSNGKMPNDVTLRIERPDGFEELSEEAWVAKLREALNLEEERTRRAKSRRSWCARTQGRPPR